MNSTIWKTKVDEIIKQRGASSESLLACLEILQDCCRYIPEEGVDYLRDNLNVPPSTIYGVISFYGMLTTERLGTYTIRLCQSLSCRLNGSEDILKSLEENLGIRAGETSADGKISLHLVACLGLCDQAPAMMINDRVYGNLTAKRIKQIVSELKG